MNRYRGFTLIELLVVVAIIGLLSSVVLSTLGAARARANYASAIAEMKQIAIAGEIDYNSRGSYAADVGSGTMPGGFTGMSRWPTPPCGGWTYDWENWGDTIRITLRRADGGAVYYYCMWTTPAAACYYGNGYPIQDISPKQITCSE